MRQLYKNAPFAETCVSAVAFGVALYGYHRTEKEQRPAWIQQMLPYATPVVISIMSLFANRFRENREIALKNENDSFVHMQQLYNDGIKALAQPDFLLAEDNFRRARLIFEEKYASSDNVLATDLHAKCCYQNALALYYLKKYDESKKLIAATLPSDIQVGTVKQDLLNLSALISFKCFLSVLDDDQLADSFRNESEALFRKSLGIDANQTNVTLFLKYLENNNQFLIAVQPTVFQNESSVLAIVPQENVLKPMLTFLIADAYRKQKTYAEAIYLFEELLPAFQINSKSFFDMFVIPMHGLRAYCDLLESNTRQREQFDIFQNTENGIQKISGVTKEVIKLRMEKLARIVYHFLDHAKTVDGKQAKVYCDAGRRLLNALTPYASSKFLADLRSLIDEGAVTQRNYVSLFSSHTAAPNFSESAPAAVAC